MKISVTLDDDRAQKLKQLRVSTRLGIGEIVNRGIDLLYGEQVERSRDKVDGLLSSDFVGCADGPEDLASDYKQYLTRSLDGKHGTG